MTGAQHFISSGEAMPIRLLLTLFLLGLTFSASVVHAATPGPYLELEGYGSWLADSRNQSAAGSFNADYQGGTGWGLALGYDFAQAYPGIGRGRFELEGARRRISLNKLSFVEGKLPVTGKVTVTSVLVNTIGEYRNETRWVPYVTLGVGYAHVAVSQVRVAGTAFIASSSASVFAYQAGTGLGIELGDHLTLDVGYRYFATLKPKLRLTDGSRFKSEVDSHNLLLGVRLKY